MIGYLHRGVEKLGESHRYAQVVPWTDRTDYVAAPMNNLGCVMAFEKLVDLESPERAQYWRVIFSELSRIASHLVWLGTHALDIGALSMSLYCFRERELILDIFEAYCGARLTTNIMEIGGFSRPIPEFLPAQIRDFLEVFPERQKEYDDAADRQSDLDRAHEGHRRYFRPGCHRLLPHRRLPARFRRELRHPQGDAVPGLRPARLRGSPGNARRCLRPISRPHGRDAPDDPHHRQCLDAVETMDTPLMAYESAYVIPPHKGTMTTAEDMQRHFIWVIKGFSPPVGEAYVAVEHPKGENGYYVVSDGTSIPYRFRIRSPDFVNLGVLPYVAQGAMLADVVALIGTIDIVLGSVDR